MDYKKIYDHIDENFESHIKDLQRLLRQDSLSLCDEHNTNVDDCAKMLVNDLKRLGATAELCEFKDGYPVVFGRLQSKRPKAKTIIFYSLYDIMPWDEPDWKVDPLSAKIVDAETIDLPSSYGKCICARGARNQKGPTMGFIKAVESMLAVEGDVPVNIMWVLEGEEEIASVHLGEFRDRYVDQLKEADGVWYGNPSTDEKGIHHVYGGAKGLISIELTVEGGDWGGPKVRQLFAADDNWVDAPCWRLIHALASLRDVGNKVKVKGFYDNVRPPTKEDKELIEKVRSSFNENDVKQRLGIEKFQGGKAGNELLEKYILGPVFNIDGFTCGYQGPFIKTNLPRSATVKIDIRIVPNMQPKDILQKVRTHLDEQGFTEVDIKVYGFYNWSRTPIQSPLIQASLRAADKFNVESLFWPSYYACVPLSFFADPPLSLPVVSAGIGRMGRPHMANEYITIEGLREYEKYAVSFLNEFANI